MKPAEQAFKQGKYQTAIDLYNQHLSSSKEQLDKCLFNLSSVYFASSQYQKCLTNCVLYVKKCQQLALQPKVQCYVLYCKSIIKLKRLLSHQDHQFISQGQKLYPYHKVLQDTLKTVKQIQISQNQDEYLDKMYQKLLMHPQIRNYLTDESFLTKVQKIIRNPSLASALSKTDKRLQQVSQILLMAQEDQ